MQNTDQVTGAVLEMVMFETDENMTEQHVIKLFKQTEALVKAQPGFMSRQLIRAENGCWTDLVLWRSRQEAEAAAATVPGDPCFAAFMAAIRPGSVTLAHHRLLWSMVG